MPSSKISSRLLFLFKLLVTTALFIFIWQKINAQELITCLKKINLWIFFLGIWLYVLAQIISTYRWKLLLKAKDINVSFKKLISFYFVGMFFNMFLPTLIGGDLTRSYDLSRHTKKISDSIVSIFTERLLGLLALIFIVLLSLIFTYQKINEPIIAIFVLSVTALIFLAVFILSYNYFFNKILLFIKIFRKAHLTEEVKKIHENFLAYRDHKLVLLKVFNLSFLVQLFNILIYYFIAQSLGLKIPFIYFALFIPIIALIAMLPISFQGLGIREGVSVFLFGRLGVSPAYAVSLSLIYFAVVAVTSLWGGGIFLLRRKE